MDGLERVLRRTFLVTGSAVHLATVRVALFAFLIPASTSPSPARMAALPDELRQPPVGAGWIYALVEPTPRGARVAAAVMVGAAIAAMIGWHARSAALAWSVTAVWAMGIPNLFGKVDHNHHLIWLALLLAASPCSDALSIDSYRRAAAVPTEQVRYGFPIRIWWLLMGMIYFFPGLAKIGSQGLGWASPANMAALLHAKWTSAEPFVEPLVRIDRWPLAMVAMSVFTLAFEVAFVVLVFTRWRRWLGLAGVGFHIGTYLILEIPFTSLLVCYLPIFLVPLRAAFTPHRAAAVDVATGGVGAVLVAVVLAFGVTHTGEGWPVASYPPFSERPPPTRVVLSFERDLNDGSTLAFSQDEVFGWVEGSRRQYLAQGLLALHSDALSKAIEALDIPAALSQGELRVVAVTKTRDPDDPDRELERRVIGELDLTEHDR